jgi:hypothetical protein
MLLAQRIEKHAIVRSVNTIVLFGELALEGRVHAPLAAQPASAAGGERMFKHILDLIVALLARFVLVAGAVPVLG